MPSTKKTQVVVDPALCLFVVEVSDWYEDPTEDQVADLQRKIRDETGFDGPVLVMPPGCKFKAVPLGGVYHRERYENDDNKYEMEMIAASEADLKRRLADMQNFNEHKKL